MVCFQEDGLYCKICKMYFSSVHNRREHMFGKQHLQNVTGKCVFSYYQHQKQGDNRFGRVCLSVCPFVCPFVYDLLLEGNYPQLRF